MPRLIHCPSCGKDVSTDALRCPHCGRDIQKYLEYKKERDLHLQILNKAIGQALGPILGIIVITMTLMAFSIFFSIEASGAWETHKTFSDPFWNGAYDGHYKISAIIWTIVSVLSWCPTIAVAVMLCRRYIKKTKQQHPWRTIKEEYTWLQEHEEQE